MKDALPLIGWGITGAFVLPSVTLFGLNAPVSHHLTVYAFSLFGLAMFASGCWMVHATETKRWRLVSYTLGGALQATCVIWLTALA